MLDIRNNRKNGEITEMMETNMAKYKRKQTKAAKEFGKIEKKILKYRSKKLTGKSKRSKRK